MPDVTRTCKRCKADRPLADFYIEAEKRAAARRNRTTICERPCRYCQQEQQAARRAPRQAIVDAAKRESGCVDCGIHPEILQVLEFDHRDDEVKCFDVSDRMTSGSLEALREEIAKCDVVCANCHRIRTVTRNQFGATFGGRRVTRTQVLKDRAGGLGHLWDPALTDLNIGQVSRMNEPSLFDLQAS